MKMWAGDSPILDYYDNIEMLTNHSVVVSATNFVVIVLCLCVESDIKPVNFNG